MLYEYSLIHTSDNFEKSGEMYSIALVEARELLFSLNGTSIILSGKYLFCLSDSDTAENISGDYTLQNLLFMPYFYNINLNTAIIDEPIYEEMREKYGYPDFYLFRNRNDSYKGIIKLTDSEYESVFTLFSSVKRHIEEHSTDSMWSCRTRSDIISILRIAESAHIGKHTDMTNEVLRFIRSNLNLDLSLPMLCKKFNINRTTLSETIKKLTGLTPARYILSERLGQSRPELLFTDISIDDISNKYGFTDVNYYIRAFRQKYGVTPLQYRKNGFEKRVREEKNYHLKNGGKGLMTPEEFEEFINQGQGIAIIRLRRERDKSRFRDVFRRFITIGRWHITRNHCFEYENELLSCFEDSEELKEEIISYMVSSQNVINPYQVHLLKNWCSAEQLVKLKETLGTIYENLYRSVFNAAQATDKSLFELFDKKGNIQEKSDAASNSVQIYELNNLYNQYHTALNALTVFDDNMETIKSLISAEYKMREETGYVPYAPAFDIFWSLRNSNNTKIAGYIKSILPDNYFEKYDLYTFKRMSMPEIEKLDVDCFLNADEMEFFNLIELFSSEYMPFHIVKEVNLAIMDCDDKEKRLKLMSLFLGGRKSFINTVKFLPELKKAVEADPTSRECNILSWFVFGCRDKKIKEYAKELLEKGDYFLHYYSAESCLYHSAANSYFIYNYDKEDRELFAKKLSEKKPEVSEENELPWYNNYLHIFKEALENGISDLPVEMAHFVFRQSRVSAGRREFVKALYMAGVNDPHIIEEALFDSDSETRKYAALMRDNIPYIEIKKLQPSNAADVLGFFDEKTEFGIDLDYHMTSGEIDEALFAPIKAHKFYDCHALSYAARVELLKAGKIDGFIAYINKKPVGFIDCGSRCKFVYLNAVAGDADSNEFVITNPRTFGDMRVKKALIERAVHYTVDFGYPNVKAYLAENRFFHGKDSYGESIKLFEEAGFTIEKQDDSNAVLMLKKR